MSDRLSRRAFLGAGAVAGTAAVGAVVLGSCSDESASAEASHQFIDHLGDHQPGITTPQPSHAIVAAFDTTASSRAELQTLLQALADETDQLVSGKLPKPNDPLLPPADNGILGDRITPDDLTITLGLGASLFDDRFGLRDRSPKQLTAMPNFPNDEPHEDRSHGDLVLQLCGATEETVNHALRRLMRVSRRYLTLRWMMNGFVQPNTLGAGRTSTRNLLGFKDGTANLATTDSLMDEHVWIRDGDDEPAWAVGGSYQVVRVIRNRVEFWDRTALRTQELIIGRSKDSGAPLDGTREQDEPRYGDDPQGVITPLTAHIRIANPRTDATAKNLILRRGFNYSAGFTTDGQLDQGLLFVCFQRSLRDGFIAVQERLNGEALEEYIRPVGGGFFFVPAGRRTAGEPFAAALFT